jgi:2,4-dienoyl-CoA reductase-like NADH-dependent reductase (Old Yellow Enzyme family)/thioredoxin reductase
MQHFPYLFSPLRLRNTEIRNRIMSTGHQTYLAAKGGLPGDDFIAYHEARAAGGAGLIVIEAARFHPTGFTDSPELIVASDDCIPGLKRLVSSVHKHGARIFGQLSHSGRVTKRIQGGLRGVAYAPSVVPDQRFHTIPRALPLALIGELIEEAGKAARRFGEAGFDGVELLASHGMLISDFLNPRNNQRVDAYGGTFENRLRFLVELLAIVRKNLGDGPVLGIRISVDEVEPDGLENAEVIAICHALKALGAIDYVNTTMGSMQGLGGSVHVVPPMEIPHAYVAPQAGTLRAAVGLPVFVAGRINQPQIAEAVLIAGQADMCGMTRAMISDPEMANKAREGRLDDIRACIGCNQACIGHYHMGYGISCIQNPVTGREVRFGRKEKAKVAKRVFVAGGGPAGMKAAVIAAERGHQVTLFEARPRLGGQALLAQLLPERAEFGGIVTNLRQEMHNGKVEVRLNTALSPEIVQREAPDSVIVATGATPYRPPIEGAEDAHVIDAWALLEGRANPGGRVLVADWRCDWIGLGVAEMLARSGRHVRLAVTGTYAGQNLQPYLRDHLVGKAHKLGVEIIPYARLFGVDADAAYLTHIVTGEPIIAEQVDSVILALGHQPNTSLEDMLAPLGVDLHFAGDCLAPRSAEEAVYEGMLAGLAI